MGLRRKVGLRRGMSHFRRRHPLDRNLDNERTFIRKKIDEVKGQINQLENNLQFFTNVKDDNPLVKEVHANIAKHKADLETWKTKLTKVREMYS